jgi:hypothetical protein
LASFSELVSTAVRAATSPLVEGSRRNAREALQVRHDLTRQGFDILATLATRQETVAALPSQKRSTA